MGSHLFGTIDAHAQRACLHGRRCQVCGQRLPGRAVLFARAADLRNACTVEPATCPRCAAYSTRRVPDAGRAPRPIPGQRPPGPGRHCRRPMTRTCAEAAPAEQWFAVWVSGYDVRPHPDRSGLLAASWAPDPTTDHPAATGQLSNAATRAASPAAPRRSGDRSPGLLDHSVPNHLYARCAGPDRSRAPPHFVEVWQCHKQINTNPHRRAPTVSTAATSSCQLPPDGGSAPAAPPGMPRGVGCTGCVTCDRCETVTPTADCEVTARGSRICQRCLTRFYWQCEQCDGWNRDGDDCGNGCDAPDCDDCATRPTTTCLVHHYPVQAAADLPRPGTAVPRPGDRDRNTYSGYSDCARLAADHLGDLGYLKADELARPTGSRSSPTPCRTGGRSRTSPGQMLTELADAGCDTTDDTGIHVHLSRAGFASACHTYRWMKLCAR